MRKEKGGRTQNDLFVKNASDNDNGRGIFEFLPYQGPLGPDLYIHSKQMYTFSGIRKEGEISREIIYTNYMPANIFAT